MKMFSGYQNFERNSLFVTFTELHNKAKHVECNHLVRETRPDKQDCSPQKVTKIKYTNCHHILHISKKPPIYKNLCIRN